MKSGMASVTIYVPYDAVPEALKLSTAFGLLLEATVTAVKRKAP